MRSNMTKIQLAKIRQKVRELKTRRNGLEHIAMAHHPMAQASLIERRLRPGNSPSYYLSIPTSGYSWHMYVRKDKVDYYRRHSQAWSEFCRSMAEWVTINKEVETLLRKLGKGRCEKLEVRRGRRSALNKRK